MCGLKVSRVWFFTRFGHDWPFWSKKGMLLHSSAKVGRKNHSFCLQYGKGFWKWAAHSTWFFWEFPLPEDYNNCNVISTNSEKSQPLMFKPFSEDFRRFFTRKPYGRQPRSQGLSSSCPLGARGREGGGRIIDPGNEVVRVFQKIFRNNFPNVWKISRTWNRLVSSLRCLRLSPVVRETISLRRKNLVIYCKLCNKWLL